MCGQLGKNDNRKNDRIVGGQEAGINEFPWQVGLFYSKGPKGNRNHIMFLLLKHLANNMQALFDKNLAKQVFLWLKMWTTLLNILILYLML